MEGKNAGERRISKIRKYYYEEENKTEVKKSRAHEVSTVPLKFEGEEKVGIYNKR